MPETAMQVVDLLLLFWARLVAVRRGLAIVIGAIFATIPMGAYAAITINSATLSGGASVTVLAGATISASLNVTTSGSGTADNWSSSAWRISTTPPGATTCDASPNFNGDGTYNSSFNITAPVAAGTYNVYFIAYNSNDCSSGSSSTYIMATAVTVVVPPVVSSINLASANPTAPATSVSWVVTFSKSVSGVDATDFALASAGVSGASITSVAGSGSTWTVTANTGSGSGTLGLNLVDNDSIVDAGGIPLGGSGAGNGNFTGSIYTVFSCVQPANTPAGLSLTCVCDTFNRASLNPSTIFGANWIVSTSDSTGILPSIVSPGYLRLTNNTGNNAKSATVPGIFPAAGNYISVEFQQYAYNGSGADGIAVTLSDYSVPAVPGAYGGSLGYAQKTGIVGFAGGWIGVAMDEYGNYQNPNEGRIGGPGFIRDSVGMRGSGSGMTGYNWLGGTATLNPQIDNNASATPSLGYYYQVIVDARNEPTSTAVTVNRDTGVGYAPPLISIPNVYAAATAQGFTQAPVPTNWQISFTGSTGGSTNIHEIGGLRICAQTVWPPSGGTASGFSAIDEVYPVAGSGVPAYQNFQSGHIYMKLVDSDPLATSPYKFKLWVAALTGTGISSGYSVASTKYVRVNLVDNSDNACGPDSARTCNSTCTNKPAVEAGATNPVTFAMGGPGASLSPPFSLKSSWKNLVAVMKECTTSACTAYTATAPACSADSFSVRPTGVSSVISTNATNAGASGTPIFKAGGDNFSLTATTIGIAGSPSGYTGNLKINNATLQVVAPAAVAGAVSSTLPPARFPAAVSGTPSSTATGDFTYSEVGAFWLPGYDPADTTSLRGVFDGVATVSECTTPGLTPAQCDVLRAATWTGVDGISTKGDCILDSYRNTRDISGTFSSNPNYGKFGCNFGLTSNTAGFGRFVPDHFTLVSAQTKQRSDIPAAYAMTRETTGTIVAGMALLTVADATDFSVGDAVVVFGAGAGGRDLLATVTAAAGNTLTLNTPAATGVTNAPVFERRGFTYMDEPLQLALSLEARNAAGGVTQNYATTSGLAKLDNSSLTGTANNSWGLSGVVNNLYGVADCRAIFSNVAPYNTIYSGGGCASLSANVPTSPYSASASRVSLSNTGAVTWVAGTTSLTTDVTLKRANRPDGAFDFTNGAFTLGIWPKDGDGITFLSANDGASLQNAAKSLDTDAVAGADVVAVGVADMRFGRMRFSNAYGSELLDLVVPMEVQYWNWNMSGGSFVRNVLDSHTSLVNTGPGTSNFGMSNYRRSLAAGETSLLPAATITFAAGAASMRLTRPGIGNSGSAKVCVDLDAVAGTGDTTCQAAGIVANKPYLQGGAGFNTDPSADVTFGTHKSGPVIYLREGY